MTTFTLTGTASPAPMALQRTASLVAQAAVSGGWTV
jgi:hypothetical protein